MDKPTQVEWNTMLECLEWYQRHLDENAPYASMERDAVSTIMNSIPHEVKDFDVYDV